MNDQPFNTANSICHLARLNDCVLSVVTSITFMGFTHKLSQIVLAAVMGMIVTNAIPQLSLAQDIKPVEITRIKLEIDGSNNEWMRLNELEVCSISSIQLVLLGVVVEMLQTS